MLLFLLLVCGALGLDVPEKSVTFPDYSGPDLHVSSGFLNSIFYVKFENPDIQNSKNLLVWIQGGPGCSGLAGMAIENGPVYSPDGKQLMFREVNWLNLNASLLYIEQPLGTGFSALGNNTPVLSDLEAASQNAQFFIKFVEQNPQYENIMFAGESHGGLYIPLLFSNLFGLAEKGSKGAESVLDKVSHVSLGNPRFSCTPEVKSPWESSYVKSISFNVLNYRGLVPFQIFQQWKTYECDTNADQKVCNDLMTELLDSIPLESGYLSTDNFLYSKCLGKADLKFPKRCDIISPMDAMTAYLNRPEVQAAMHVPPTNWSMCTPSISQNWTFDGGSMVPILEQMAIDHKMHVLVYNGDLDILEIPATMTRYCLSTSKRLTPAKTQSSWKVEPGVWGGMTQMHGSLQWSSIHKAGHLAPWDQPELAFALLEDFLIKAPLHQGK